MSSILKAACTEDGTPVRGLRLSNYESARGDFDVVAGQYHLYSEHLRIDSWIDAVWFTDGSQMGMKNASDGKDLASPSSLARRIAELEAQTAKLRAVLATIEGETK